MKRSSSPYLLYLLLIVLLLPTVYGHEEGAQAISKESLMGPLYAFLIIISAIIIARIIKKYNIKQKKQNAKGGKKHGRKK